MPLTKRLMILFDPDQYHRLEEEARRRHCSVGALVRQAVEKGVLDKSSASKDIRLEAARRLVSRQEELPEWEEMEELIAQGHLNEG